MAYAAQLIRQYARTASVGGGQSERLYFIEGKDYSGHLAYCALLVHALRLPQWKKTIKSGKAFEAKEYGEIVAKGYGEIPDTLRAEICETYGVKH